MPRPCSSTSASRMRPESSSRSLASSSTPACGGGSSGGTSSLQEISIRSSSPRNEAGVVRFGRCRRRARRALRPRGGCPRSPPPRTQTRAATVAAVKRARTIRLAWAGIARSTTSLTAASRSDCWPEPVRRRFGSSLRLLLERARRCEILVHVARLLSVPARGTRFRWDRALGGPSCPTARLGVRSLVRPVWQVAPFGPTRRVARRRAQMRSGRMGAAIRAGSECQSTSGTST